MFDGMFIAGIDFHDGKRITYHINNKYFDNFRVREIKNAPEWDGHTSADVLEMLKSYF